MQLALDTATIYTLCGTVKGERRQVAVHVNLASQHQKQGITGLPYSLHLAQSSLTNNHP